MHTGNQTEHKLDKAELKPDIMAIENDQDDQEKGVTDCTEMDSAFTSTCIKVEVVEIADNPINIKQENKEIEENEAVNETEEGSFLYIYKDSFITPCGSVKDEPDEINIQEKLDMHREGENDQIIKKRKRKRSKKRKPYGGMYPCSECSQRFDRYRDRQNHYGECHKEFKCTFEGCNKVFKDKSSRKKHSDRHAAPSFQCQFCASMFKRMIELNQHIKNVHTKLSEKKEYTCDVCLKVFYSKHSLDEHSSLHTGEKKFSCPVEGCGKKFRLQSTYKRHELFHLEVKPFQCHECGKKFPRKAYLESHMHKHTGIKQFTCDVCDKGFSQKGNLTVHMSLHKSDRPEWKCSDCMKTFSFKSNFTKHMKTVHGAKEQNCKNRIKTESAVEVNMVEDFPRKKKRKTAKPKYKKSVVENYMYSFNEQWSSDLDQQ